MDDHKHPQVLLLCSEEGRKTKQNTKLCKQVVLRESLTRFLQVLGCWAPDLNALSKCPDKLKTGKERSQL